MHLDHKNLFIRTCIVFIITVFISDSSEGAPNVSYLEPGSVAEFNPIKQRTIGFKDTQLQVSFKQVFSCKFANFRSFSDLLLQGQAKIFDKCLQYDIITLGHRFGRILAI